MNLDQYLAYGIERGYIKPFCYVHDMPDMNDAQAEQWYEDGDICIFVYQAISS